MNTRRLIASLTLEAAMVTLHTFRYPFMPYWRKDNTRQKSLKQKAFVLNFLRISYIHSSHLCSQSNAPLSFPNVESRVFWSTEMTANPKSTLGRGKSHKCFKISDEYCRKFSGMKFFHPSICLANQKPRAFVSIR